MANFNVSLNLGGLGNAGSASQNVQTGDTITLTIGNTVSGTYNRAVIAGAITPGNQTGATQNPNVLTAGGSGSYNVLFTSGQFGFGASNTFVSGSLTGTISAASNTPSYSVTAPSTISEDHQVLFLYQQQMYQTVQLYIGLFLQALQLLLQQELFQFQVIQQVLQQVQTLEMERSQLKL